ncbi:MAG: hypothetical protein BRD55_09750 [Bacteroidetes bacterium SW_9_63_38]|nr:MAG: hypothetical protein BRD55_09750 [Bacteroidetes bacterium SW_9_63_38]
MSISPLVPLLLTVCWVLPALIAAVLYRVEEASPRTAVSQNDMNTSVKGIRAEVLQLDLEALDQDWRRAGWDGPTARVRSRVVDASHEVMVITPYAETSVSVGVEEEHSRRCSLCLN